MTNNTASFTNIWYPKGKLQKFRSSPKKCEEYWKDLAQAFGVSNYTSISSKKNKVIITYRQYGFAVDQRYKSTNIGPRSSIGRKHANCISNTNYIYTIDTLVVCNFLDFYLYNILTKEYYGPFNVYETVNNTLLVLEGLFGNKWAKRFNDTLIPEKAKRGFDGIPDGSSLSCAGKMKERWEKLVERIAQHGGVTTSLFKPSPGTLSTGLLAWNKNPQCPPNIWDEMNVPLVPVSQKTFEGLAVERHSIVNHTLDNINYLTLSFSMNSGIDIGYGLWLIDKSEADFAYAILKSSMFRAWCELTAYTDRGEGHFTTGMWDTFPLPDIKQAFKQTTVTPTFGGPTPTTIKTIKMAISEAGRLLKTEKWTQYELDDFMDGLFIKTCPIRINRQQILAEGLLDAFYGA